MSFEGVVTQILQPHFFYSTVFFIASFVCVKVFTRFCYFVSERTKSFLYIMSLIVFLVVMVVFLPSTVFQTVILNANTGPLISAASPISSHIIGKQAVTVSQMTTLPITGIFCLIGLAAGAFFTLTMVVANDRVARRMLRVIPLSSDEQSWL
jgi:beta-lactamase regulating signal transducer with metallopeptidase domain